MVNRSKAKGTDFETLLVPLLQRYYGPDAGRRAQQGANDKGDFLLPGERRFTIEAKNVRQMDLAGWIKEAQREANALGVPHGVVVHKRVGTRDPEKQWVTMELGSFLSLVAGSSP